MKADSPTVRCTWRMPVHIHKWLRTRRSAQNPKRHLTTEVGLLLEDAYRDAHKVKRRAAR